MARKRRKSSTKNGARQAAGDAATSGKPGVSGAKAAGARAAGSTGKGGGTKGTGATGAGTNKGLRSISRRTWIKGAVGVLAATGGASALHAWDSRTRREHDLSAIGNGVPVVVQVHDRSCPTCRRLKAAMSAALSDRDDIHYRIADLAGSDGRELSERYKVPKVSLLFFDAEGEHRYSHTGILDAEEVEAMVNDVMHQMNRPS